MTNTPGPVPGLYRHYKGGYYWVHCIADNSTNGEPPQERVVYHSKKLRKWHTREVGQFFEDVEPGVPRFMHTDRMPPDEQRPAACIIWRDLPNSAYQIECCQCGKYFKPEEGRCECGHVACR